MQYEVLASTPDDGPLDGFLVNTIWGLVWCLIFMGGVSFLQWFGMVGS